MTHRVTKANPGNKIRIHCHCLNHTLHSPVYESFLVVQLPFQTGFSIFLAEDSKPEVSDEVSREVEGFHALEHVQMEQVQTARLPSFAIRFTLESMLDQI